MPHPLDVALAVATFLATWRWVYRPLRKFGRRVIALLHAIDDSSKGVQMLAHELHKLAGAVAHWVVRNEDRLTSHDRQLESLSDRIDNLSELLVDVAADVSRIQRSLREST